MKRIKNPKQQELIRELKTLAITQDVKLWKRIAAELEKPTRNKRVVNLSKLNRVTKEGDLIIVPGKVLSAGELNHNLTVSAYNFSESAKQKISKNGKILSIKELMKQNPKAKGIKIIG
jgi:large subunit ribosomal protein L18e